MTDELPPMQQMVVLDHDFRRRQAFVFCHDLGHFLLRPTKRSRQCKAHAVKVERGRRGTSGGDPGIVEAESAGHGGTQRASGRGQARTRMDFRR